MPVKALFQKLKVGPTLTPGDQEQLHLRASGGRTQFQVVSESEPLCSRWDAHHPGWECWTCSFVIQWTFPEFQIPYLCFALLIKRDILKWNLRWSVRVRTCHVLGSPAIWTKRHKDSVPVTADCVWQWRAARTPVSFPVSLLFYVYTLADMSMCTFLSTFSGFNVLF